MSIPGRLSRFLFIPMSLYISGSAFYSRALASNLGNSEKKKLVLVERSYTLARRPLLSLSNACPRRSWRWLRRPRIGARHRDHCLHLSSVDRCHRSIYMSPWSIWKRRLDNCLLNGIHKQSPNPKIALIGKKLFAILLGISTCYSKFNPNRILVFPTKRPADTRLIQVSTTALADTYLLSPITTSKQLSSYYFPFP